MIETPPRQQVFMAGDILLYSAERTANVWILNWRCYQNELCINVSYIICVEYAIRTLQQSVPIGGYNNFLVRNNGKRVSIICPELGSPATTLRK